MSGIRQFDIGTAALEHLELLNQSNQNPLEVAAQFRTLLRSKKNPINPPNLLSYPTINWKYLRRKRYEQKLEQFIAAKFTTIHPPIRSPSPSIRTPCISPIALPQTTYTVSRLNTTSMNNEDILFPIADCNLVIKTFPPSF